MVARVIPVEDFDLVIFGGTGDLARRKILPGPVPPFLAGQMPPTARVIGAARGDLDDERLSQVRRRGAGGIRARGRPRRQGRVKAFLQQMHFLTIDATGENGWKPLARMMRKGVVRAFYFSVAPSLFGALAERLHKHGIANADIAHRGGKAVRPRPGQRAGAERDAGRAFPRDADLPDRPLSRQGDGAEPDGGALRQHAVRAVVELALRRPHPDHRGRDGRASAAAAAITTSPARCATWCRTT